MGSVNRLMSILAVESELRGRGVEYFSSVKTENSADSESRLNVSLAFKILARIGKATGSAIFNRYADEVLLSSVCKKGTHKTIWISSNLNVTEFLARRFPAEEIVYWVHSLPAHKEKERFTRLMKLPLNLVTPSVAIYREIWRICQESSIGVFHYHIPNFHSVEESSTKIKRSDFGVPEGLPILFHGGGDGINKGKYFIERVVRMIGLRIPLCFVSIGREGLRRHESSVVRIEIERISPEKLSHLISFSDVCLMPSLCFDNAPLLLLEYRAANRKVVASRSGGIEEYADPERTWFVENPNNVDEWIEKIEAALRSEKPPQSDLQTQKIISKSEWIEKWESLFQQIEARG